MKKIGFLIRVEGLLIVFLIPFIFVSCTTLPQNIESFSRRIVHWDESVPKEQSVGLFLDQGLNVTLYNGISVDWPGRTVVYLPPGTVNFVMDVNYHHGNRQISGRDWPFQWAFNAGDRYYLMGYMENNAPVIKVADPNDKTPWYEQASYQVPLRQGPLILQ